MLLILQQVPPKADPVATIVFAILVAALAMYGVSQAFGWWHKRTRPQPAPPNYVIDWSPLLEAKTVEVKKTEPPKEQPQPVALPAAPAPAMKTISIQVLAAADNLLIVGNRGSGKTTLLAALLHYRLPAQYIFDPHSEPDKWQNAARVIGGGRSFQDVYVALQAAERTMDDRSKELALDKTAKERFVPFSVISDEWGSVVEEIEYDKAKDLAPGKLVRLLLKEGRKFKISFIASAHGDTNASLGCAGDKTAFENSFDWFIYMGAFVAQRVSPDVMKGIPLGRNPEGGTFPLVVVAYSPTTRETRLLDLRDLAVIEEDATYKAPTPLDLEKRLDRSSSAATDDGDGLTEEARKLLAFIRQSKGMPSPYAMQIHLFKYNNASTQKKLDATLQLLRENGFWEDVAA